ncbi:MAG: response regulator [Bacillota bacterium]
MSETGTTTVLVVDDHTLVREGIVSLLSRDPSIKVIGQAETGEEGVAKALHLKPDVVLMDISLPQMNGLEATAKIRTKDPEIKVLILSMYDNDEYVIQVLKYGASGYVLKKAMAQELINAIKTICSGETYLYPSVATKLVNQMLRTPEKSKLEKQDPLTERENEILSHVARGFTNKEIAELLDLSNRTVQTHRANIMKKLGIHSTVELVKYAIKKGLVNVASGENENFTQ